MAVYTQIDNPELYFQCKLYTGNGTDDTSITLDGDENMQPNLVWLKRRDNAGRHRWFDSVRGATKWLRGDHTDTQGTAADSLKSFDSDGFTLGDDSASGGINVNINNETMVAWCWKAGTAFSNDASATSIGSIDSSGSINTTAGISIVNFTGNGTAGATVAHGLSAVPRLILVKVHTSSTVYDWRLYHGSLGATKNMIFNDTSASATATNKWNDTAPTSSVFSLGDTSGTNESGSGIIAYSFAEKQGFSKFGIFEGTSNADGQMIWLGFRPAWVMTKSIDTTSNWNIFDNKRSTFNDVDDYIKANASAAEDTDSSDIQMDFVSNGFKIRGNNDEVNGSETFIYMAFAEAPFVNSKGVPCNAR